MGHAMIWAEGLAVALVSVALAVAWATRGGAARWLWVAVVALLFLAPAAAAALGAYEVHTRHGDVVHTTWLGYSLSWLAAFVTLSAVLLRQGRRRPEPGLAPAAATWPRQKLWLGLGGAVLALGLTFWNMDLSARAELAIARQEAGAVLLAMTPPPVPEPENAARVYEEALKELGEPVKAPWSDAAKRGPDAREPADWKAPYVVGLVKRHEAALALLRKAAAMPRCSFDRQRTLLDAASDAGPPARRLPGTGAVLLAVDARVKAAQGNLERALEDVSAILGIVRHVSQEHALVWGWEVMAWRTLEDVLRLAAPGKGPLPTLSVPELPPLVRKVREEHALLGMVFPAAASQPSLVIKEERQRAGRLTALAVEAAVVPSRVFIVPDEIALMRKTFDDYRRSPRSARDETPADWEALRKDTETDRTGIYSAVWIRPKRQLLLAEGSMLAALRQTARAGLAAAAYRRKHGRSPERIEQLVPDFLPATPTDPRDGQVLRIKRTADGIALYAPQDAAAVEGGKLTDPEGRRPPPIFRLSEPAPPAKP
jgi:hypothetical protein